MAGVGERVVGKGCKWLADMFPVVHTKGMNGKKGSLELGGGGRGVDGME